MPKPLLLIIAVSWLPIARGALPTTRVPIVSKSVCTEREDFLVDCKLKKTDFPNLGLASSVLPLRTVATVKTQGDCSVQLPVSLEVIPKRDPKSILKIPGVQAQAHSLKMPDAGAIGAFNLRLSGKWSEVAFDSSCEATLEIAEAEADFSSYDTAMGGLEDVKKKHDALVNDLGLIRELIEFRSAFSLILSLSEVLNERLNSEAVQDLRLEAPAGLAALKKLVDSGGVLSETEKEALARIEDVLLAAKDAAEGKKSVKDFFSPEQRRLIERLASLSGQEKNLTVALREKTEALAVFCHDLKQIPSLLKPWIPESKTAKFAEELEGCREK